MSKDFDELDELKATKEFKEKEEVEVVNEFDDGYKITLPFKLNDQQREVIKQIDEFVENPS